MVWGVQKFRDHEARKLTRTDADIRQAVKAWCGEWNMDWDQGKVVCKVPGDPVAAQAQYGHISEWRTEQVTDMNRLFEYMSEFNEDLSCWDVSAVTDMQGMFYCARSFNQDLSAWNVSAVTDMEYMFYRARSFNQDLSAWDVSAVTDMRGMFYNAKSLANYPKWYIFFK